jgi:hypothetical protein
VRTDLLVPFADTRASALSWWLGDDAPDPLATLVLAGRPGRLELRLLGASHHVVATAGPARCPEVVACGERRTPLPPAHESALGAGRYRFTSTTTAYDDAGLARVARALRRRYDRAPDALLGAFPGSPHALTVLTGRELRDGWSWASWHVYPGAGEVVRTRSRLVARAAGRVASP